MSMIKKGLVPLVAVAACCVLAACGSSSSSSSSSASASGGGTTTTASNGSSGRAALAACLKQHGVTLPSRPAGAGGYGPPTGGGAPPAGGGAPPAGGTPRAGGYGGGPRFFGGGNRGGGFAANPKLRAAFQACGGNRFRGRSGGTPPRNSSAFKAALTKYVACVRQHGYNLPNPDLSGKGPVFPSSIRTNSKFEAASKACQSLLARPGGAPGGASSGTTTTSSTT